MTAPREWLIDVCAKCGEPPSERRNPWCDHLRTVKVRVREVADHKPYRDDKGYFLGLGGFR